MVTDQYLAHINGLEQINADEISAFLVIAAKLLQIKSEALLPRPPAREPGEEDVGLSLVDQLKTIQTFQGDRHMAERATTGQLADVSSGRSPPKVEQNSTCRIYVREARLCSQRGICKREGETAIGDDHCSNPRYHSRKIDLISKTMKEVERSTFRALLEQGASRLEIVVTFLALLEM